MLPFAPLSAIVTRVALSGHCNVPITVIKAKCRTITNFVLYGKNNSVQTANQCLKTVDKQTVYNMR